MSIFETKLSIKIGQNTTNYHLNGQSFVFNAHIKKKCNIK